MTPTDIEALQDAAVRLGALEHELRVARILAGQVHDTLVATSERSQPIADIDGCLPDRVDDLLGLVQSQRAAVRACIPAEAV